MSEPMNPPTTLLEAVRYFADADRCLAFMVAVRWPDGNVICPRCGSKEVTFLANARVWKCRAKHASRKFSIKVGTVMEDSPIGLDKWLPAIWLITNAKNGISSYEIHRGLGVTQKTAWFMLHRIRLAMQTGSFIMSGEVEADETYIGGLARNMHVDRRSDKIRGTGGSGKAIVMALLERRGKASHSRVKAYVVPNTSKKTLHGKVGSNVEVGSDLFTDEALGYKGLDEDYQHQVINHAVEYVRGNVHTNGMENFWSLLKRAIKGTYVSVETFHLFRYLDAEAFRFNEREDENCDGGRFLTVLRNIVGKQLTFKKLIGHDAALATT